MSSVRFILSAKNGVIQKQSKLANKYLGIDNLSIDTKFFKSSFRDREISIPYKDTSDFVPTYSLDDLPLSSSLNPKQQQRNNAITSPVIDTDIVSAKLLDSNQTVYLDTVYAHDSKGNSLIIDYVDKGYSFSDAANIINHTKTFMNEAYIEEAFGLLKEGYPIKLVFKYMDEALLDSPIKYKKGLMNFIVNNPNKKHMVIVKDRYFNEVFDKIGADNYRIFESLCEDENSIKSVMRACRCRNKEGARLTNDKLSALAVEKIQRDGSWTDVDNQIFNLLKNTYETTAQNFEYVDSELYNKVSAWIKEGIPTETIFKKLKRLKNNSN